jgi:hypothetical protein
MPPLNLTKHLHPAQDLQVDTHQNSPAQMFETKLSLCAHKSSTSASYFNVIQYKTPNMSFEFCYSLVQHYHTSIHPLGTDPDQRSFQDFLIDY